MGWIGWLGEGGGGIEVFDVMAGIEELEEEGGEKMEVRKEWRKKGRGKDWRIKGNKKKRGDEKSKEGRGVVIEQKLREKKGRGKKKMKVMKGRKELGWA